MSSVRGYDTFLTNTSERTLKVATDTVDGVRNAMQELSNLVNTEVAFSTTKPVNTYYLLLTLCCQTRLII